MPKKLSVKSSELSLASVPAFWPMAMAAAMVEEGTELYAKNLKFVEEEIKIHDELRPKLATPNQVRLDLRTMVLRDYGKPGGMPTLVDAPHAGHTAMIADYHKGQSLVETLLANGIGHVALTDWKSATEDMKDLEIDNYLAEVVVAIDDLGGRVNLVGLCQGGWVAAMIAARFPDKVNSLVLAGAPIDTDAGNGPIKRMVHDVPDLVLRGAGGARRRPDEGQVHAAGLEEHASRAALYPGPHRSLRAHRRSGLSRQGGDVRELVRKPDRPAGALVSSGDHAALQGEPARQGQVRRAGPQARPATISLARPICWPAPPTTSRRRSRFSMPPNISARRRIASFRRRCRAAISGCSWARAR